MAKSIRSFQEGLSDRSAAGYVVHPGGVSSSTRAEGHCLAVRRVVNTFQSNPFGELFWARSGWQRWDELQVYSKVLDA